MNQSTYSEPLSLDASSHLHIGSSTITLGDNIAPPPQSTFTVAEHIFTAQSTGLAIAGTSLAPGASAVIILSTPISLAPGGTLATGSRTLALPSHSVFEVAGHAFTADPRGYAFGGHAVVAGSHGVYVDVSKVSPNDVPTNVRGGAAINHGNSIAFGNKVFRFPTPIRGCGEQCHRKPRRESFDAFRPIHLSRYIRQRNIGSPSYHLAYRTAILITLADGAIATLLTRGISVQWTTLHPGGPPVTISRTVMSLPASSNLIVGYTLQALPTVSPHTPRAQ